MVSCQQMFENDKDQDERDGIAAEHAQYGRLVELNA